MQKWRKLLHEVSPDRSHKTGQYISLLVLGKADSLWDFLVMLFLNFGRYWGN